MVVRGIRAGLVLVVLLAGAGGTAGAQAPPAERDDLNINIFINYGAAYREGSWAPVDVIVQNDQEDVSGTVEVRLISAVGEALSPVYRVPAESPRHSQKRFRLYCKMEGVAKVEARLFHGRRPVTDIPFWINVTPIRPEDFLCLVLDERPDEYAFLSTALYRSAQNVRFYRESLSDSQLNFLADRQMCYDPFDLIILGDIDPGRIAEPHRVLLENYVRRGGVLAVFTGDQAGQYRGTWVEALIGASIGPEALYQEPDLSRKVFGEAPARARAERQGMLAALAPLDAEVRRLGTAPVLATLRPLDRGAVASFAIDSRSMLLQDLEPYHQLWRDLLERGNRPRPLGLMSTASALEQVPRLAGVQLFPLSSVIIYLLLYFLIAIVANWLFWNYMKRREWAWVCLIFFSFGFTAYAMLFGTQGRARNTELELFEVLQLPRGTQQATVTTYTGLLSEGSSRYDGVLTQEGALIQDLSLMSARTAMMMQSGGGGGMTPFGMGARPFEFIQDTPPRFEDFYVGASDLRFLQVLTEKALSGGIEGGIDLARNMPEGSFVNNTGLVLLNPLVLANGQWYQVNSNGNELWLGAQQSGPRIGGGYSGNPNHEFQAFKIQFVSNLLGQESYDPYYGRGFGVMPGVMPGMEPAPMPPYLVSEVAGDPEVPLTLDAEVKVNLKARFLVAELAIVEPGAESEVSAAERRIPLGTFLEGDEYHYFAPGGLPAEAHLFREELRMGRARAQSTLRIVLPEWLPKAPMQVQLQLWSPKEFLPEFSGTFNGMEAVEKAAPPQLLTEGRVPLAPETEEEVELHDNGYLLQTFLLPGEYEGGQEAKLVVEPPESGMATFIVRSAAIPQESKASEGAGAVWQ